uniref:Peptidase C1A papain C-terminal domain-containing protein n=1 Tax=Oryza meridionalis TaxID=40149 RepID=A0A0E0E6U1_9ORYZ
MEAPDPPAGRPDPAVAALDPPPPPHPAIHAQRRGAIEAKPRRRHPGWPHGAPAAARGGRGGESSGGGGARFPPSRPCVGDARVPTTRVFQGYTGGIISSSSKWEGKSQKPDHIVLLTGYDADEEGAKFWTIKNSWGKHWGHGGYGKLERGSNDPRGTCGIL